MRSNLVFASRPQHSARAYREIELSSRIEGASPYTLVSILYDELGATLDVLARSFDERLGKAFEPYQRAATILRTLDAGLDREGGGTLATSLASIYAQLQRRLVAARGGDRAALQDVRQSVANLAEAWRQIG